MPDLLFELGCEELPAAGVRRAYVQLEENILERLRELGLQPQGSRSLGTPRRLIVGVEGLPDRQEDQAQSVRGPSIKAAFGPDGAPTPAVLGFCRGQGIDSKELRQDGDYVWADKVQAGRPTRELLAEVLPAAVRAMTFDKTMRWGEGRMRFARPIRWILASLGGEAVDFEIEGVRSGLESRGHRFNHPEPFRAAVWDELIAGLRSRQVEPDPAERERRIREDAVQAASGTVELTDALVDENVFLTEWPSALEGAFREEFLALPEAVLVTAMAKHERFFPVRDGSGKLTNRFVSIRNGGVDEVVREGNAWVLNARFNDAKFFFDEDAKHTMADFLARTERMTFQEKLGSVRERADRLSALAERIAADTGADERETRFAKDAGLLCKADLACGLVSELPSLQGVIGREYALREGMDEPMTWGIGNHYNPARIGTPDCDGSRTAMRVLMADQIDKLAGYLGVGIAPSGSSDPFGLRRAAGLLIEGSWAWPTVIPSLAAWFESAFDGYARQGRELDRAAAMRALVEVFVGRYEALLLPETRHDALAGAIRAEEPDCVLDPRQVRLRAECLERARANPAFVQTMTRPLNIVSAARAKGIAVDAAFDRAALDSPEGMALADAVAEVEGPALAAAVREDARDLLAALQPLAGPIDAFFEATMVMVDEPRVRDARLGLLDATGCLALRAGDFSKLEGV